MLAKRKYIKVLILLVTMLYLSCILLQNNLYYDSVKKYTSFVEAVRDRADENKTIILLSVDAGYIDMGLNILETSLLKFHITNFLFVCSDNTSVEVLESVNIPCYLYNTSTHEDNTVYGSKVFAAKTHIKTHIILEALRLGYSVFILDVDIVLFRNPLDYFSCMDCDIQIQSDGAEANTGFYIVRPTKAGIELHNKALQMWRRETKVYTNQRAIDHTLKAMVENKTIKAEYLDVKKFPHGKQYFEIGGRMFAGDNPCVECVMVHNNWIVGGDAKRSVCGRGAQRESKRGDGSDLGLEGNGVGVVA